MTWGKIVLYLRRSGRDNSQYPMTTDLIDTRADTPAPPAPPAPEQSQTAPRLAARLGEELPIFCERCGYALHGLPQTRCGQCDILHFSCPECGHHQPINTLRPAFQRMLGRVRALWLVLWVLFKLNFFGWLLFGWFAMGVEWSYEYHWQTMGRGGTGAGNFAPPPQRPRPIDMEAIIAFTLFAIPFAIFGRLILLRWRRGLLVGVALAALVMAAVVLGAKLRQTMFSAIQSLGPLNADFYILLLLTAGCIIVGAVIAWPIWLALAHLFLPARTAKALLDWQQNLSTPAAPLARD